MEYSRVFGPRILIEWSVIRRGDGTIAGFEVQVFLDRSMKVIDCLLDEANPSVPFSIDDRNGIAVIAAGIFAEENRCSILKVLQFAYPGGGLPQDFLLYPAGPPPPPPVEDGDQPEQEDIITPAHFDLFPYVYMRPWPPVTPQQEKLRFIYYTETREGNGFSSPPSDLLYCELVFYKHLGDRAMMEQCALDFIEGGPPYEGQFIDHPQPIDLDALPCFCFQLFPAEDILLIASEQAREQLCQCLEALTPEEWRNIEQYINTPEYLDYQQRVWQTFFALAIYPGYRTSLLDAMIRTIRIYNLIGVLAAGQGQSCAERAVYELATATIVLPETVFPLPPYPSQPGAAFTHLQRPAQVVRHPVRSSITPYAVGGLQMVRQRLARYSLGEVACIENVMKGELKESSSRKAHKSGKSSSSDALVSERESQTVEGVGIDMVRETMKTLAQLTTTTTFNNLQTSYGPPTNATINGDWTVSNTGQTAPTPETSRAWRFARDVTERTVRRITREILESRSEFSLNENEEIVVHKLDNSKGENNLRGIYRWVNKVFSNYVEQYGERLIIEFILAHPAAGYKLSLHVLHGENLVKPPSPSSLGIVSFRDITRENYAAISSVYGVTGLKPPPPESVSIDAAFYPQQLISNQQVPIPAGYQAAAATIGYTVPESLTEVRIAGLVGTEAFEITVQTPPQATTIPLNTNSRLIPVAVTPDLSPSSPPDWTGIYVDVRIDCVVVAAYEEWRIYTYDLIVSGYERKKSEYYAEIGRAPGAAAKQNPLAYAEIERTQLRRDCVNRLFELSAILVGESGQSPPSTLIGAPQYLQFFEQAFEWNEMAYSFWPDRGEPEAGPGPAPVYEDPEDLFTAFLQAPAARVLLPVRPGFDLRTLYFLSSGVTWDGEEPLTPTVQEYARIVNDLKTARSVPDDPDARRSRSWEVTVPTTMMLLQEGSDLPVPGSDRPQ